MRVDIPPPDKIPDYYYNNFLKRIKIIDTITGVEYITAGYKIHARSISIDKNMLVDTYMIGCPKDGLIPYFDVIMEMAFDCYTQNMNCVIVNKGDNPVEIKVDDKTIVTMEAISQTMVHWHDEAAYTAKKWISFNFRKA